MHSLKIYYHPDDFPEWLPWKEFIQKFEMIGKPGQIDAGGKPIAKPGFAPRESLGKPPNKCDRTTGRNLRRGYNFQVKFKGSGHAVLSQFRMHGQRLIENSRAK